MYYPFQFLSKVVTLAAEYEAALHVNRDPSVSLEKPYLKYEVFGRAVEQASGFALLLVAYTFSLSSRYVGSSSFLDLDHTLLAILAFVIAFGQIVYSKLVTRLIMTMIASSFWLSIAIQKFVELGDWNIATSASVSFAVFNFYVYGYVYNLYKTTGYQQWKN
jgi:hypothetical protein